MFCLALKRVCEECASLAYCKLFCAYRAAGISLEVERLRAYVTEASSVSEHVRYVKAMTGSSTHYDSELFFFSLLIPCIKHIFDRAMTDDAHHVETFQALFLSKKQTTLCHAVIGKCSTPVNIANLLPSQSFSH